jgi:hypothetical protein
VEDLEQNNSPNKDHLKLEEKKMGVMLPPRSNSKMATGTDDEGRSIEINLGKVRRSRQHASSFHEDDD